METYVSAEGNNVVLPHVDIFEPICVVRVMSP